MIFRLCILLFSLVLVMLGSSMLTTVIPLNLQLWKASTNTISVIAASNFIGLIVGALYTKRQIMAYGYQKAFMLFAILIGFTTAAQGMLTYTWAWLTIRFINGYCLSGIYIIVESWLLTLSTTDNRNRILASYLTTFYAATALGQFSLRFFQATTLYTLVPFIWSSALCIAAIIPVRLIQEHEVKLKDTAFLSIRKVYQSSPLGMLGCLAAGMILGIFYSFGPLFLGERNSIELLKHISITQTANFMGFTILGGTLGQFPIGWLADRFNRCKILTLISFITTGFAALLLISNTYPPAVLNLLAFGFGACAFSLYQLSMSQAMQTLPAQQFVAATSSLILIYSIGSALGPLFANLAIKLNGHAGIFGSITLVGLLLGIYSAKNITKKI